MSTETLSVQYDALSKRVTVAFGGKQVVIPGKYETLDEAQAAAIKYARKNMGYK